MNNLVNRLCNSKSVQIALLVAVCLAVFGNSLSGGFVWDDNLFSANQVYWGYDLKTIFLGLANGLEYQPVRDLTFLFDILVWRGSTFGFHLSNLLIFTAATLLVMRLAERLCRRCLPDSASSLIPFVTALIFAVHPLKSEVVAWVTQRNTLLATLFFLLATLLFIRWQEEGGNRLLAYSCSVFLLAVFSKATVVVLPLLLAFLLMTGKAEKKNWLALLPFLAVAALGAGLHLTIAGKSSVISASYIGSFQERIAVAMQIPFFYLKQTVFPANISAFYVDDFSRSLSSPGPLLAALALVMLAGLVWLLRRKLPEVTIGFGWFIITLLPVSNLFATSPVVADRYLFLPSAGLAFMLAALLSRLFRTTSAHLAVCGVLLLPLSVMTVKQNKVWHDDITLWSATAKHSSGVAGVWFNLGRALHRTPQLSLALEAYLRAVKLNPADIMALDNAASLFPSTRGSIRERHPLVRSLAEQLPDYPAGLEQIGGVPLAWRYPDAAEELFLYLLAADPQSRHLRHALASFYRKMGAEDRAAAILQQ